MNPLLRALIVIWILGIAPARAARTDNEAEVRRLLDEMKAQQVRGKWAGVDHAYEQLVALDGPGSHLDVAVHIQGAQAASALGDVVETWRRYRRVLAVEPLHEVAITEVANIEAWYGEVTIKVSKRHEGPLELTASDLGFSPEQHGVVARAQKELQRERGYHGLLPLSRYEIDGTKLEVIGGWPVSVKVR